MSSSSLSVPLAHQAAGRSAHGHKSHDYRQTTYHNGAVHHIAETRRHHRGISKVESATKTCDWVMYPAADTVTSSWKRPVEASLYHSPPRSSSSASAVGSHVTGAKHLSKDKPIVVQMSNSREAKTAKKSTLHISRELTPPPTPRLGRLPSPDFANLDEAPFCGCGIEARVVKLCKSCNTESTTWFVQK